MSFDNNSLCVNNICNNLRGLGLNVTEITFADSPYSAAADDVIIIADATGGNITINLQDNPILPNQEYIFKKEDFSANTVTIVPPVGQTINGGANYVLVRGTEMLYLTHNGLNWEITNDKFDRLLTNKGDLYTHDGTELVRFPVGPDSTVLFADASAPNGLVWKASSLIGRIAYSIISSECWATSGTYTAIGYFPWLEFRHSIMINPIIIFAYTTADRTLDIRVYNSTTAIVLGEATGLSGVGAVTLVTFINPVTDSILEVQVRQSGSGVTPPKIFGMLMEFDI